MNSLRRYWVVALCCALAAQFGLGQGFVSELSPKERRITQLLKQSEHQVTAFDINEFHRLLLNRVIYSAAADGIRLEYGGIVLHQGERKLRIEDSYGSPVEWRFVNDFVIASIWISIKQSLGKCKVGKRSVFVNVLQVDKDKTTDDEIRAFGQRSLRQILEPIFTAD